MTRSDRMDSMRHELLKDVASHIMDILKEFQVKEDVAEQCGAHIADFLADHWGGQYVVIPKDHHYKLTKRDLEIWEKFNGTNHLELARQYNLTPNAIYRIIKRIRKLALSRSQSDLFEMQ